MTEQLADIYKHCKATKKGNGPGRESHLEQLINLPRPASCTRLDFVDLELPGVELY